MGSLAIIVAAGVGAAGFLLGRTTQPAQVSTLSLPLIDASGAVTSEKFSMATGPVSDRADGLFVLDHNSGLLQCSVLYPRDARFGAAFSASVSDALATGAKGGQYMMVTGTAHFPGTNTGSAVVYVLDTASGQYACYGVPFRQTEVNARRQQMGALQLIAVGMANPVIDRDGPR